MAVTMDDYHPNFDDRKKEHKEQVGWQCEECGAKHGEEKISKTSGEIYTVYVQAAHLDHDPENGEARLKILCQSCHLKYDGPMHNKKMIRTKRMKEIEKAIQSGQLKLFEEVDENN
jgi:ribosomal protein L37AE/L43A